MADQETPSSDAARLLLPRGEKGAAVFAKNVTSFTGPPSPLVGEGAQRADEGALSASSKLLHHAREMRREPTEAEARLWLMLRDRRFDEFKFRRQVPIGPFIADFVCYGAKLIVEADGSQHAESAADSVRDAELRRRGFHLIRFWNNDILARPDEVMDALWTALHEERS
ncbi:Very-short-patch-repair endonuclease [Devosia crocina]|uniref:Very-short-patch-repair endonuclease n=1 Tax=Devosia crocina TaxID=429728 RepID=A0A1I7NM36_9HYPH|nr:DUF559 domain-containing protein [Devosia crocina]SFV35689.1 Very-short-patch-repair endonuclease [Devosia crocina]